MVKDWRRFLVDNLETMRMFYLAYPKNSISETVSRNFDFAQLAKRFPLPWSHYQDCLRLNPNDNQGVRDALISFLLIKNDLDGVEKILNRYKNDFGAQHAFNKALFFQEAWARVKKSDSANRKVHRHHHRSWVYGKRYGPLSRLNQLKQNSSTIGAEGFSTTRRWIKLNDCVLMNPHSFVSDVGLKTCLLHNPVIDKVEPKPLLFGRNDPVHYGRAYFPIYLLTVYSDATDSGVPYAHADNPLVSMCDAGQGSCCIFGSIAQNLKKLEFASARLSPFFVTIEMGVFQFLGPYALRLRHLPEEFGVDSALNRTYHSAP